MTKRTDSVSVRSVQSYWVLSRDGDPRGRELYERHYSARQYRDGRRRTCFVGPGEKLVLLSRRRNALLVWRKQRFSRNGQVGVCCQIFRNESTVLSSHLLRSGMAAAWQRWPEARLFTYVDPKKVRSTNPGFCFLKAGWRRCGWTKNGLQILEVTPKNIRTAIQ